MYRMTGFGKQFVTTPNVSLNSCVHFLWLSFKFAVIFILAYLAFVHFLIETVPLFLQVPVKLYHCSEFLLKLPFEYLA